MYKRIIHILFYVLIVLALAISTDLGIAVAQDISHEERQITWGEGPSNLLKMNERIDEQAQMLPQEARENGAVKRVAFFDIAFPNSPQEFVALGGNGVILVTAISHDPTELPLKRVHINVRDKDIELKRISYMLSKQTQKSLAVDTFGQYRMDGMYLFPVYLKALPGKVVVDFARNRNDFGIAEFNASDFDKLNDLPSTFPSGKGPSPDTLKNFITREFPGFEPH
jgi:hypothetical protein